MKRLFTTEQEQFIRTNYKGIYNKELTELVNKKFGSNFTVEQIKAYKQRNKLDSGLTGHFPKGIIPFNKGKKGIRYPGCEKSWFKKGQKPHNYRPIGSERICSKDGYTLIKISDVGKYQERWKLKHKVMWEEKYGPVPAGHKLVFADGDKTNITLDNLILVTDAEMLIINKEQLIKNDRELTETGVLIAKVIDTTNKRKKR